MQATPTFSGNAKKRPVCVAVIVASCPISISPDHEMIDRASREVRQVLIDVARGTVAPVVASAGADGERGWSEVFDRHGILCRMQRT